MSLLVTSFCKSIQARCSMPLTCQNASMLLGSSCAVGAALMAGVAPRSLMSLLDCSRPLCNALANVSAPFAAPATAMPSGKSLPGTKAASVSFQIGRLRWWQVRCTFGFQPPLTARQSHEISRVSPRLLSRTLMAESPSLPSVLTTSLLRYCGMPSSSNGA